MLRLFLIASLFPFSVQAERLRVIDGDTLKLGETTYRINGIDAPEAGQVCKTSAGKSWQCGDRATALLKSLTDGQKVHCSTLATDIYGRQIAQCYAGRLDLGQEMVVQGMAWAFLKFSDAYEAEQTAAKQAQRGVWNGDAMPAWEYRAANWSSAAKAAPEGCAIKGNISKNGKIYHTPWSPWYKKTRINTAKGERWFCNEAEAQAAGWRPARGG